jgi:hypothetical protein
MRVYIGIATSDTQHVKSLKSCYGIARREGDGLFLPDAFATGSVTRSNFGTDFLAKTNYESILLLDADQVHHERTLEVLRETMETHNLDMVCAHYYRRQTYPVQSLCYELGDGKWPYLPMLNPPESGLYEIAITGLGCVLIHRRVVEAVAAYLPKGSSPFDIGTLPEIVGDSGHFGSDFRFFIIARKLGFRLWLNADIESLHATTLWLGHKSAKKLMDYGRWADDAQDLLQERLRLYGVNSEAFKQRKKILEARKQGLIQQLDALKPRREEPEVAQELNKLTFALYVMDGRLYECDAWIEWAEKYPTIERPDQLPTTANTPEQETIEGESLQQRESSYKTNATELIGELPNVRNGAGKGF